MTAKKDVAKKDVAKKDENKELANAEFMFEDAGAGMETADKDSFAIPFLSVLQKISPQVDEAEAEYIEGAKAGMLLNTVTQKLYDGKTGVIFLPCAYQRRFLRWGPRGTSDGGFKGEIMPEEAARLRDAGEVVDKEGKLYFPLNDGSIDEKKCDHLADTRNHFGILVDEETGEAQQVLLSLGSTQIKKSKMLMSLLNSAKIKGPKGLVTPPTWANRIRLTTAQESNDKGSWMGLKVQPAEPKFVQSKDLYDIGKAFHATIASGEAKVNYEAAPGAATGTEEDGGKF